MTLSLRSAFSAENPHFLYAALMGAALEYFPIKNYKDLRMHLSYCFTDGKSPATTALQPVQTIINTGITWKVGLLNNRKNN